MTLKLKRPRVLPAILTVLLFVVVASVVFEASALWSIPTGPVEGDTPVTPVIGEMFFDEFFVVFEVVAVLLVAALVAAVYLAKPEEAKREAVRRAVSSKPRVEADEAEESMGEEGSPTDGGGEE